MHLKCPVLNAVCYNNYWGRNRQIEPLIRSLLTLRTGCENVFDDGKSQYCEWRSFEIFSQPFHSVNGIQVWRLTIVWVFFSLFPSFILFPPCNQGIPNFHAIFEIWYNQVSNCDFMLVPRTQGNFITINLTNESVLTFLARQEKKIFFNVEIITCELFNFHWFILT